jgi:hypothetical protein
MTRSPSFAMSDPASGRTCRAYRPGPGGT